MALDDFLRPSGYRWDPSAFTLMCRAFLNADRQEVYNFIADVQLMPYDSFLKTIYWGIVCGWILSKHAVCSCGSRYGLQVHHKRYSHHGEEHRYLDDLAVKCRLCHAELHGLASAAELQQIAKNRVMAKDFRDLTLDSGAQFEHISTNVEALRKKLL